MNRVNELMSDALNSLDGHIVIESLCTAASTIVGFANEIKNKSLRASLERYGLVCSANLNGWTFPGAVWSAIVIQQPRLNHHPLGEITERAIKKTIILLTLDNDEHDKAEVNPDIDELELQMRLRYSLRNLASEGLLELFLSQYFFEMCIDQQRRSWNKLEFDSGYWYNFSEDGHFVSQIDEFMMRKSLANHCEEKAKHFLPYLKDCLNEKNPRQIKQKITEGFLNNFGVSLKKEKAISDTRKPINIIVGDASLNKLKKSYIVDNKAKHFRLHGDNANISFSYDTLESWLGHSVHSLIKDLLDIGVILYMSDIYTKRGANLERSLDILMPVRHPRIWSNAQMELERTASFLGRDDLSIKFVKHKAPTDNVGDFYVESDNRCVCPFSGGLDTLTGASWVINKGFDPVFISHYSNNILGISQKSLINELEEIYDRELDHIGILASKARQRKGLDSLPAPPSTVMIQHLRSFMFLSFATAVAIESKIKNIYILENGPVTFNSLFSEARVNTRTTHPHFLAHFEKLVKKVFNVDISIENPFLYLTKGEIVKMLADPRLKEMVTKTNSCWNWARVPLRAYRMGIKGFKGRHDGECIPCIIRRISVHSANLWDKDAEYLIDVFNQFPEMKRNNKTMIADFLRFQQNINSLSDTEILLLAPDISIYEEGVNVKRAVNLYRRQAQEVIDCFQTRSSSEFREIFDTLFK